MAIEPLTTGHGFSWQQQKWLSDFREYTKKLDNLLINVADHPYNADPTGSTDSTAAIQAAIDAAGIFAVAASASQADKNSLNRCTVLIPSGRFKVTAEIIVNSAGVHIKGAGIAGTQIEYYHDGDLFNIRSDDQFTTGRLHNVAVSDMSLRGRYTDPSTGASIRVGYVKHVYIYDIRFNGGFDDIILEGTQEPIFIDRCDFFQDNSYTTPGVGNAHVKIRAVEVDPTSVNSMRETSDTKHWAYPVNVNINQCEMRTAANGKENGIFANAVDGLYVNSTHLLNQVNQVYIERSSDVFPCANIRISNSFFDGESPTTLRNIYVISTENAGATAPVDLNLSDCKFNGVGDAGAGVEAWIYISDKSITSLSVDDCTFNKAKDETAAGIELLKGSWVATFSGNKFLMDDNFVPTAIFRLNAGNVVQADFFSKVIIDNNKIFYSGTDRADYTIRIANAQTNTVIMNNTYTNSSLGADRLVQDTKTSGITQGAAATLNNIAVT